MSFLCVCGCGCVLIVLGTVVALIWQFSHSKKVVGLVPGPGQIACSSRARWVLSRLSGFQLGFLNYLLVCVDVWMSFVFLSMRPCYTLVTWCSCRQPEGLGAVTWMDVVCCKWVIMDQNLWQWWSLFAAYFTDLNSQYYLLIRRQLMFEIAETYNEMGDLKLSRANRHGDTQSLDNHTIKKINHLCSSSAKWVLICARKDAASLFRVSSFSRVFRSPDISRCSWTLCALLKVSFQSAWKRTCCDRPWRQNSEWRDSTPCWSALCLPFNWTTSTSLWRTTSKTLQCCWVFVVGVEAGQCFNLPHGVQVRGGLLRRPPRGCRCCGDGAGAEHRDGRTAPS